MARLTRAPVFFTVAQMRFNPVLDMELILPALQNSFRLAGYPDYEFTQTNSIEIRKDADGIKAIRNEVARHIFRNKNRTAALLLDPAALTLELTDYPIFEEFSATFLAALEIVNQFRPIEYCDRLGMRMLDLVQPIPGEQFDLYVTPEVLGLAGLIGNGVEHQHTLTESLLRSGSRTLLMRTIRSGDGLLVPHDLAPLRVNIASRFLESQGETITLDSDCFTEERSDFSIELSRVELRELKLWLSRSFKAVVTEHALKVWE